MREQIALLRETRYAEAAQEILTDPSKVEVVEYDVATGQKSVISRQACKTKGGNG